MKNHLNLPLLKFSGAEREVVDELLYDLREELDLLLTCARTMLVTGVVVTEDGGTLRLGRESNKLVRLQMGYPQDEKDRARMPVDIRMQVWEKDTYTLDYTIPVYVGHQTVEEME